MHTSYLLATYLPRGAVTRIEAACAATGAQQRWLARPAVAAPLLASETLELVTRTTVFSITAHCDARLGLRLDVNGREIQRREAASGEIELPEIDAWLQAFEAFGHVDAVPLA